MTLQVTNYEPEWSSQGPKQKQPNLDAPLFTQEKSEFTVQKVLST